MMSLAYPLSRRLAVRRKSLMLSCASLAIAAVAVTPQAAHAQAAPPAGAFRGTISSSVGSVVRNPVTNTTETITIGSNTATINWSPNDTAVGGGPINFLPTGNVATFTSTSGITDYTVLNRIVPNDPSRSILLDGSVVSTLEGTSTIGGNIWFYSPGGILIGSNAVFDVGGLLLTTADLPNGFGTSGDNFSAFFSAPNSNSSIQVQPGAQINAHDSYVAMIAPRIEQGGTVNVDGSAAYVAAEQLTMTFDQGLFDISVDLGTDDANGIVHTGTTTGTGNLAPSDQHTIYMVAVPKNNALSMLLTGGHVGFTDAVGATVDNGQIVLSAGYSVSHDAGRNVVINDFNRGGAIGGPSASIDIEGGDFSSSVSAFGTGAVIATGGGGTLNFDHNVYLQGLIGASLVANDGDTVTVGGNARVSADDLRYFVGNNESDAVDAHGGSALIDAFTGGSMSIAGNATVTANSSPTVNLVTDYGGTSTGGFAGIGAEGGNLTIGGNASVQAMGFGDTIDNGLDGRNSFGGQAQVVASDGGSLGITGNLEVLAEGNGSYSALASGGTGGTGTGGIASIAAITSGSLDVHGTTVASASGIGGQLISSPDGTGGAGNGGSVQLITSEGGNIHFRSNADFFAQGVGGGSTGQGGQGMGGFDGLFIDGGTVTADGRLLLFADGYGGNGMIGGTGYGGTASAFIGGGEGASAGGTLHVGGDFRVQAGGHGGNGIGSVDGTGGAGGDGYGGNAEFYVTDFLQPEATITVQLANAFVAANGEGGFGGDGLAGGNGGNGISGEATTELCGGNITTAELQTFATARGGNGGQGSAGAGGNGGSATGGFSSIIIGTVINSTVVSSYDRAFAGNGGLGSTVDGNGGNAFGGHATMDILADGALNGDADLATTAFGGNGANGGDANGGTSTLSVLGTVNSNNTTVDASATGGNGSSGFGGASEGGSANLVIDGGTLNAEAGLHIRAVANENSEDDEIGNGGNGVSGGGESYGGSAIVEITSSGGDLHVGGDTDLTARALGGAATGNGNGGDGYGGYAGIIIDVPGSEATTVVGLSEVVLNANGLGGVGGTSGTGGAGGGGYGGSTELSIGGGTFGSGNITAVTRGRGGTGGTGSAGVGGNGGYGEGGATTFWAAGASAVNSSSYTASSNGAGGAGGTGSTGMGDGGVGQGGYGEAVVDSLSANFINQFLVTSFGNGGTGANGGDAYGGNSVMTINGSLSAGLVQSTGQAQGGAGSAGNGGDADAGSGTLTVNGSLAASDVIVGSNAVGGSGSADGGSASGGDSEFTVNGSGTAQISGTTLVDALATGGNAVSGAGGTATGGDVWVEALEGGSLTSNILTASVDALGGTGAIAGDAFGGFVNLMSDSFSSGVTTSIELGTATLSASANAGGGAGSEGDPSGSGGSVNVEVSGGSIHADSLSAVAQGSSFGGVVELMTSLGDDGQAGSLNLGSLDALTSGGSFGGGVLVSAGSGTTANIGAADIQALGSGGFVAFQAGDCSCTGGQILAGSLDINSGGSLFFITTAGGHIDVSNSLVANATDLVYFLDDGSGGVVTADVFDVHSGSILSNIALAGDHITLDATGGILIGDVNANDSLTLTSGTDIFAGNLSSAGNMFLAADGGISVGNLLGGAIDLDASGSISLGNVHGDSFEFSSGGSVSGGNIFVSTHIGGDAEGAIHLGDITVAPVVQGQEGSGDFSVGIASATSIDVGDVSSPGSVGFATLGDLTTGDVNAGDVFLALVGGDMLTGGIATASSGRVYIGNASMFLAAGGPDDFDPSVVLAANPVATGGSITVEGPITTGLLQAAAGTGLNLGDVAAQSSVNLRAGTLASFAGTVSAPTITVTSDDIQIANGASLGVAGVTHLITLNATNDEIVIGEGDGGSDGYYLNEDGDISSDALVFNAIGNGEGAAPDINIFDVVVEGSQTDGPGVGNVTVNTGGSIIVRGQVDFVNAGPEDSLALNAGDRIEVITDTGGISMTNNDGDLAGTLSLTAHDIWVASQALIDQLEENPDFDGRNAALETNGGVVNPDGYVQAGAIDVTMLGSSFLVQNSGTADDFAGLTVGTGGLDIANQGSDQATVVIFGRQIASDGTVIGNDEFAKLVDVTGSGGTTSDSAVNSCLFSSGACGDSGPTEPPLPPEVASSDSVVGPLLDTDPGDQSDTADDDDDEGTDDGDTTTDASVHLINTGPLQTQDVIDEPITSGNDGPGGPN